MNTLETLVESACFKCYKPSWVIQILFKELFKNLELLRFFIGTEDQ